MSAVAVTRHIENTGKWAAIAIGCTIPVSVALDNLLLLVVLICWLAGGGYREKWSAFRDNAVSHCVLALFGLLMLGTLWGNHSAGDARYYLLKYLDLLFVPLFIHYFRDAETRRWGLIGLAGTLMVVLELSFLIKIGVLPYGDVIHGTVLSPVVFKYRVTHNFLMAFGAFLFAWLAITSPAGGIIRIIWAAIAVLAAINVTLMVEGATGYLTLAALGLLLAATQFSQRSAIAGLIFAPLLAAVLLTIPGPLAQRAAVLTQELKNWQPNVAARESSAGLRIEFYRNSLGIVTEHPLIGVGTGGFPSAYAARVQGTDMTPTHNPHNEYLHIAVQLGLAGLSALIMLFAVQWRMARQLPAPLEAGLARGVVVAFAIGCLFNSMLLDHAEGLFFAWLSGLLFAGLPGKKTTGIPS
jgi:O-antigen ligase